MVLALRIIKSHIGEQGWSRLSPTIDEGFAVLERPLGHGSADGTVEMLQSGTGSAWFGTKTGES